MSHGVEKRDSLQSFLHVFQWEHYFVVCARKGAHHQFSVPLKYTQKHLFSLLDLRSVRQQFDNKNTTNLFQFDEILTYVSMYGQSSNELLRYGRANVDLAIFDLSKSLQTRFRPFLNPRDYFLSNFEMRLFCPIKFMYRLQTFV